MEFAELQNAAVHLAGCCQKPVPLTLAGRAPLSIVLAHAQRTPRNLQAYISPHTVFCTESMVMFLAPLTGLCALIMLLSG